MAFAIQGQLQALQATYKPQESYQQIGGSPDVAEIQLHLYNQLTHPPSIIGIIHTKAEERVDRNSLEANGGGGK